MDKNFATDYLTDTIILKFNFIFIQNQILCYNYFGDKI